MARSQEKKFFDEMMNVDDIGSGNFGKVFKGTPTFGIGPNNIKFDHDIAFKVVETVNMGRADKLQLENEIKANEILSQLDEDSGKTVGRTESRFTVRHYECFRFGTVYYFAMEPLTDTIFESKTGKTIDYGSLVGNIEHLIRMTEIVAFLHVNDIIHCDLKGENFMYKDTSTNIRAIDFGLVAFAPDHCEGGTPHFLPPEIRVPMRRDVSTWNKAYDIYELGVLFGEHFAVGMFNAANTNAIWADNELADPDVLSVRRAVENAFTSRIRHASNKKDGKVLELLRDLILKMITAHPSDRPDISHVLASLHLLRKGAKKVGPKNNGAYSHNLMVDEYFYELEKLKDFQLPKEEIEVKMLSLWNDQRLLI